MKRTTILADEHLLIEAKHLATREGRTFTALLQEALRDYVERHRPQRSVSFAGIGRSGKLRTSEQMDAELKAGLDRYEGWSPPRGRNQTTSGRRPEDGT